MKRHRRQTAFRLSMGASPGAGPVLVALVGIVLTLTAIPYGGNRPFPWAVSTALFGGLALLAAWLARREALPVPRVFPFLWGGLVVWIVLQLVPGSPLVDDSLWRRAAAAGAEVRSATASVSPERTVDGLMRLTGYWSAAATAWLLAGRRRDAEALLTVVFLVTVVEAGYALLRRFGAPDPLFWLDERGAAAGAVAGTFVNRNHFATFVGLGILTGGSMLLREIGRLDATGRLRERLVIVIDALLGRRWYLAPGLAVLCAALFASGSRGGVAATFLGFAVLVGLAVRTHHLPAAVAVLLTAAFALLAVGVFALTGASLATRLAETTAFDPRRLEIYRLAVVMALERPWSGWGYGTFELAFALHRDTRFDLFWDRAHNTYLEHLVELGIPGALLLYGGYVWMLASLLRARRYAAGTEDALFPVLGLAALTLIGTHALVDFSVQLPAVADLFAILCGVCLARAVAVTGSAPRAPNPPPQARSDLS